MTNKKGFTLIELAIVVIIIGILLSLIIGGQKLISLSKLTTARTLTNSAPVHVVDDLIFWVDSVSKKSFDKSERVDGKQVTTWYDINSQVKKNNALRVTTGADYTENVINSLPVLRFGNGTRFNVNSFSTSNSSSNITLLMVAGNRTDGADIADRIFNINSSEGPRLEIRFRPTVFSWVTNLEVGSSISSYDVDEYYIITATYDYDNNSNTVSLKSGGFSGSDSGTAPSNLGKITKLRFNNNTSWVALDIGKVILYNRVLSTFEKTQIEEYLSNKWGIKLN